MGWLLLITGVCCAAGGCCSLGFLPALPDRKRLVITGCIGCALIGAAWFSIHWGLDLLYTDQAVNGSPGAHTRLEILATVAGVTRKLW